MEHRFEDHAPRGWLAGTWRNADEIFCRWEFDLANRLLFVDLADQVCIESIDSENTGNLRAELPNIALRFATKKEDLLQAICKAKRGPSSAPWIEH